MKKFFALILAALMIFTLAACTKKETETNADSDEIITGGWSNTESMEITDEIKTLIEKATAEMTGAEYTPIAYIGSQVVAGTKHRILCTITPVVPDAKATYAIVTIYEDLEGNAEIIEILNSDAELEVVTEGLMGGWNKPETYDVTDKAKAALENAVEKLVGAEYEPVALLATQVVSGTNYSILCEITAVTPSAEPHYSVVHVYENLEGSAEITDTFDFASAE